MDPLKDIEKGKVLPVYFFCGTEKYLMEEALKKVETLLVEPAARSFNYNLFQCPDAAADDIMDAAQTMPMMARRRVVIVKDVDRLQSAETERLGRYIRDPSPTTCMILTAEKEDMRKGLFQALKGFEVRFGPVPESRIPQWLKKEAESKGKSIADEAVQYLLETAGSDLLRLRNEMEKASLYTGERKDIGLSDVEAVSTRSKLGSIFDLTDAVGAKDTGKAFKVLGELLDNGESGIYILHMVTRQLRQVWKVKELMDNGKRPEAAGRELGIQPFILKKLVRQSEKFSVKELRRAFSGIIKADASLKSGRPERMVLEDLFLTISRA